MASGDVKNAYGSSGQTITITLANKANGVVQASNAIATGNNVLDVLVFVTYKTGAASTSSSGYVQLYVGGTVDNGTTYTEGATGSDGTITLTSPPNAPVLGSFNAVANATTYKAGPFSVRAAFNGTMPQKWVLFGENKTGGTSDTTGGNFAVTYQEVYMAVTP